MKNWNRTMGIEDVLLSLRSEMCSDANRRARQPPEVRIEFLLYLGFSFFEKKLTLFL